VPFVKYDIGLLESGSRKMICRKLLPNNNRIFCIAKFDLIAKIILWSLPMIAAVVFYFGIGLLAVWAGPPFVTDDPEPVEYRHWEIYLASQHAKDKDGWSGTAPHFEINYGVWPNVQLHLIVPLSYVSPNDDSSHYGFGDMELGVKYRFIQETNLLPQVGTFPLVDVPTGNSSRGLGSGHVKAFIPIWLQKSWGPWTTYGGGGYWINPGSDNKNYWFVGWEVQRDLSKAITLGAEVFYNTPTAKGEGDRIGFNAGTIINITDEHHLLLSAGRDIHGQNRFSAYIAYQLTLGPREEKKEDKSGKK
jgi:hypothetical protein